MKPKISAPTDPAAPTRGTRHAAEIRSAANKLTDEQRQSLRRRAMQLIYGGGNGGKITTHSR